MASIQVANSWLSIRELTRWGKNKGKRADRARAMRGKRGTDGVAGRGWGVERIGSRAGRTIQATSTGFVHINDHTPPLTRLRAGS